MCNLTCTSASLQAITAAFVVTGLITFRNIHVVRPLSYTMPELESLEGLWHQCSLALDSVL